MNEFLKEMLSQPQALLDTFHYLRDNCKTQFQNLKENFQKRNISKIIFSGMGSSYFSSYVPYYLLNQNGIFAEMRESGEFLSFSFPLCEVNFLKEAMIVFISQSGESGEIVRILEKLNLIKNPPYIVGITNSPGSTLAKKSDMTFLIKAGKEKSVTSKSYTCTLLLLYILAKNLISDFFSNNESILELEIENLIKEVKAFLEDTEKFEIFYDNLISFYGSDIECLQILSRGPSLATAYEGALIFKEIVKKYSEASPFSTFRHGCIECLNKNSKIIIISSEENSFNLNVHLIKKMIEEWKCGKILHIKNRDSDNITLNDSSKVISFKHNISNPFLAPIMEIIILQLFFYKTAEKNNIEPGKFIFTQKITREI